MSTDITEEMLIRVLPANIKKRVNPQLVATINSTLTNPIEREAYRDNLVSYASVMRDGKYTIQQYLNAVRYVSFKVLGSSNIEAYVKCFPDKYAEFVRTGVSAADVAKYCAAFNKSKLVNLVFEQTLIPTHILNADLYQRALNKQADLMRNAKSEKVQTDAANSLLTHLKPPETKHIEIDLNIKEDSSIVALRESTMKLVAEQSKAIASRNSTAKQVAHSKLVIDGESERID